MQLTSPSAAAAAALIGIAAATATATTGADELIKSGSDVREDGRRTTFGLGVGALYGGVGVNFGRVDGTRLTYGSLGCIGYASSSGASTNGSGQTIATDRVSDTNCGLGLGVLSTAFLPGRNHGVGLNLGLTYDTDGDDEVQFHLRPTYSYFFGGIDTNGFTLGVSPVLTIDEDGSESGLLLNFGYQF